MAGFVIIIGMLCGGICYLYGSMKGEEAVEKEKLDEVEKVCTTSRDAYEASRLIAQFMKPRRWVCRMDVSYLNDRNERIWTSTGIPNGWYDNGMGFYEIAFIRLCHYLGCEVIIRQVGSADKEDESMHDQVKTHMRESLRKTDVSTIYPYDKKKGDRF